MSKVFIITSQKYIDKQEKYNSQHTYYYEKLSNGEIKLIKVSKELKPNDNGKKYKLIECFRLRKAKQKGVIIWSLWGNNSLITKDGISSHKQIKYVYHETIDNISKKISTIKNKWELEGIYDEVKEDFSRTDYWNC